MISLFGVLLAAIVGMLFGWLWYGPLFGKLWMRESNVATQQLEAVKAKGMKKQYISSFIFTLVSAYILAYFLNLLQVGTIEGVSSLVFWIWLGFQVPILIGSILWENRTFKFFTLNAVHNVIVLFIMGLVLLWI